MPKTSRRKREATKKNKFARLKFAQEHSNWSNIDWNTVVFSDETDLFPQKTTGYIAWKRKQDIIDTGEERDYRSMSVKVWGYITSSGRRRLVKYEGTMDSDKYLGVLKKNIKNILPN